MTATQQVQSRTDKVPCNNSVRRILATVCALRGSRLDAGLASARLAAGQPGKRRLVLSCVRML